VSETSAVKRRGGQFGARLFVSVKPETKAAIDKASDRYQIAAGTIAREAIERGLERTLDNLRKQEGGSERAEVAE